MGFNPNEYTPETPEQTQARENRFLISEGKHVAVITEANCTVTRKGQGDPAVVLSVEVINETADKGKDSRFNYFIDFPESHAASAFGQRKLNALWEVSGKGKWDIKDQALMTAILVGKRCIIEIAHEEFNGKVNGKIDTLKPLNAEQKERFPVPAKWKTGGEGGGGFGSDDIPF